MEKLEQVITTYQQIIQKTELELQNARKRIYYIFLLFPVPVKLFLRKQ